METNKNEKCITSKIPYKPLPHKFLSSHYPKHISQHLKGQSRFSLTRGGDMLNQTQKAHGFPLNVTTHEAAGPDPHHQRVQPRGSPVFIPAMAANSPAYKVFQNHWN